MNAIYKTPGAQEQVETAYRPFLEHWPVPNRQFHVPTSQGETFVIECGKEYGPPVVLLHGSQANSASWLGDIGLWAKDFHL